MKHLKQIAQSFANDKLWSTLPLYTLYQLLILAIIAATIAIGGWFMYLATAGSYQYLRAAGGF